MSTKCAAHGGVRWKSQHRKKLCLSLLMSKNLKLKKVIKSFVPEPISCISDSLCLFHVFVSWSYFRMWTYVGMRHPELYIYICVCVCLCVCVYVCVCVCVCGK